MPRSKEQNEQIKEERRSQILSQALRLFASRGLAATKIADIAAAAGVSQGLIYHYFDSKEAIFTELIRHAYDGINKAVRYLESLPDSPEAKIRLAITGLLRDTVQREDTARFYLLTAQATGAEAIPEEARRIIQAENRLPYEVMARIMKDGQREGTVKPYPAEDMARLFWTSISGLAINRAVHADEYRAPDPEILIHMFLV